ncbi:hypothetical protein RIR_jg12142.t2 [Rhizophagus irregularis DAOM 181602=DAOM 197198]|nr:hypothetical protein RIR_jg12142.t2 [Rhizophagus irregularis DAOM 181602=DAOM 197198]
MPPHSFKYIPLVPKGRTPILKIQDVTEICFKRKTENPKIRKFRRASKERKPKDSRLSRLSCSEERKKPRFDWMGFHIPKNRKIPKIRSDGLLTFGKRETKIRLTVRVWVGFRESEKGELRFSWLPKIEETKIYKFCILELKSTVSHFLNRIVSASLFWIIGSIIIVR